MKKDFMQFITEKYSSLTDSEKLLADHIITNFERVLTMSVQSLAKETKLSVATVVRFAKNLGFDGYKEFRLFLARLGSDGEDFIMDFHKSENSMEAQITKMLSSCRDCLELTCKNLDYDTISKVVAAINNADKIAFIGVGTSYIACQDAEIKFSRAGKTSYSACEINSASAILANMRKGDVVFGVSHSGNTELVEKILKVSQKLNINTVLVTTFRDSRICAAADYILYTQTRESPMHKIAITSRVSQFAMLDSLFMAFLSGHYDICMENIDRIYEINNDLNKC